MQMVIVCLYLRITLEGIDSFAFDILKILTNPEPDLSTSLANMKKACLPRLYRIWSRMDQELVSERNQMVVGAEKYLALAMSFDASSFS